MAGKRGPVSQQVTRTEHGTKRTVTAKAGPVQVSTQVTTPKLTRTRTLTAGRGPLRVTAKVTTPRLPARTGRYTLPLPDAIRLLEAARGQVGQAVDALRRRGDELDTDATAKRDQAAEHLAAYDASYTQTIGLQLAFEETVRQADDLALEATRLAAAATADRAQADQLAQQQTSTQESVAALRQRATELPRGEDRELHERHAAKLAEEAEALGQQAGELAAAAAGKQQAATQQSAQVEAAREQARRLHQDTDQLHQVALERKHQAELLDLAAEEDEATAQSARQLADDAVSETKRIDRRITAARSGGEGAAVALDQAAQVVVHIADRIDGQDVLDGTMVTDRARQLAREARR